MKPVILVVEDNEDVRDVLAEALRISGRHVLTAVHGLDGLEKLGDVTGRCTVVLDMMMPVLNGWDFLARLRTHPARERVRVVVSTATPEQAPSGYALVPKPVDLDALLSTIDRVESA